MKRILAGILAVVLLTGCSVSTNTDTLFVEKEGMYALVDNEGELKTKFIYSDYQGVGNSGYVVESEDGMSYISTEGETLIKQKDGVTLEALDNIVVASEEDGQYQIYDDQGESLYKTSKKQTITMNDLPIIKNGKTYTVIDGYGNIVEESDKEVLKASVFESLYVAISYGDEVILYNGFNVVNSTNDNTTGEYLTVNLTGTYDVFDFDEEYGYLLYDQSLNELCYVDDEGSVQWKQTSPIDDASFTNGTVVCHRDRDTYVASLDGKVYQKVDSYYHDGQNYLVKNAEYIYGPHQFYNDGKMVEVNGIQLNPLTQYRRDKYFIVYVRDEGYQFYNFKGEQAVKGSFVDASDYDENNLAIVSQDGEDYYLMNKKGKKISKNYVDIAYIGEGYYAAYETTSKYEVINKQGEKVIEDYFMGENDVIVYNEDILGVFNKSGTSYVYDMNEMEVIFFVEGELEYQEEGYFVLDNHEQYYDMEGNLIYKR